MEGQSIDDLLDFINNDTKEVKKSKKKNKKHKEEKKEEKEEEKKEEKKEEKEEEKKEQKEEEKKEEKEDQKDDEKENEDDDQKDDSPKKKKKKKHHHKKKKHENEEGPRENTYRKYTNWEEQGIEITNSRFQDNSKFRLIGSWKEGEWTQTNYPTKDIDELFPDKNWPVGILQEYTSE